MPSALSVITGPTALQVYDRKRVTSPLLAKSRREPQVPAREDLQQRHSPVSRLPLALRGVHLAVPVGPVPMREKVVRFRVMWARPEAFNERPHARAFEL
jgi:hypothetical protein